jgi:PAS domain S-box-containing protein
MDNRKTNRQLEAELEATRLRLEEAEETLRAIRNHEVDAIVVDGPEGQQVFTLQGAEQPYRTLMETMSEGALTVATDGTILYCNSRLSELMKMPLNKIIGAPFNNFVISRNEQSLETMLHVCGENSCRGEFFLKTADGGEAPVSLSARSLMLNDVEAFCIVAADLTDRMRAQEALEKARDHLEEMVAERTAELSQANTALQEEIIERKRAEEALRKARDELEIRVEERTEELRKAYENLKAEIDERAHVEAQLRQAQKMEALGILSGGIAHDFNNILAAVIGFTELAADHAAKGSRGEHYLKRVMEASIRGRELVRHMLTFSRQTEQEKKPLLLSNIVKETVKFLRASTPSTINIRVDNQSESGVILGDPVQIQQVLMNLCTNAAFAMRERGGVLTIALSDSSVSPTSRALNGMEPGLYMKLTVRDTGTGIAPEIIDRIFDPFSPQNRWEKEQDSACRWCTASSTSPMVPSRLRANRARGLPSPSISRRSRKGRSLPPSATKRSAQAPSASSSSMMKKHS